MAAIYSTRLAQATLTSSTTTLYTVPAGSLAVIKDMTAAWASLARTSGIINVLTAGSNARIWVVAIGASEVKSDHWTGYQVLPAGEQIRANTTATGTVVLTVSGYVFSVP